MSILQQGSRLFYTYFHCRLDDGKIFYVGKGTRDRYKSKSGRNVHWQRVARKHGFTAHIIAEWETEKEAFTCVEVGRSFKILADAVVWLRSIGKINADYGGVHNALTGRQKTAYGYHWSYLEQK